MRSRFKTSNSDEFELGFASDWKTHLVLILGFETLHPILSITECNAALGMQSGAIPNALITASSVWPAAGSEPWRARLHNQPKLPYNIYVDVAAWVAKSNAVGEYLQVDLGRAMYVTAVATQGRPYLTSENQRVKKYRLTYKLSGNPWMRYKEYNAFKVLILLRVLLSGYFEVVKF